MQIQDIVGILFGEPLSVYLNSVAFVILVVAALRVSRVLPNSTWVRVGAALAALTATAERVLPEVNLRMVSTVQVGNWLHQALVIWALSAIIVELALELIIARLAAYIQTWVKNGQADTQNEQP